MRKNKTVPNKEGDMTSSADVSVRIQTSSDSVPSTPCWFGEVALLIPYLRKQGILSAINSQVRLARRRFGRYEVIDFLAVLFGYAISGERTLEAFYARLQPFAVPFMAGAGADSTALPFGALALFGGTDRGTCRRPPHGLSR